MLNRRTGWMRWWLLPVLLGAVSCVSAQVPDEAAWAAKTGDVWVDEALMDINAYAGKHHDTFVDELVRYQSAPRTLAEEALAGGVVPGDVYFACAMAQALGRPCRELLDAVAADPEAEWAGVVRALDAEHAGDALARLKRGIVESYDRWARPIRLDATLRRAFPGR